MCPRPVVGLQIAVGCNFEVLQVLGAERTREDSGGQQLRGVSSPA